ncbi:MAG: helix-turn-helix transcriptional regulator [Alphaproteobacteria bacterium]|jgi:y4mF family transcriptional regulator|nr:helix-turn-helix transcriptional regulator [Alphaproteobacteria bacterium]MBP9878361.1 helix-turn-helix transcriptional regulator [Alphaproteobacteria bacterium]
MIEEKMRKLGRLVRETRKEQGLTQEQLAATTGVGLRFMRELEQGKESCHIGKVMMVMAMLGLDLQVGGHKL